MRAAHLATRAGSAKRYGTAAGIVSMRVSNKPGRLSSLQWKSNWRPAGTDDSNSIDDANGSNNDACLNTCVAAKCGDSFVGPGEHLGWHRQIEYICGLQVQHRLEFDRLLHGKVFRLLSAQDTIQITR